MAKPNRWHNSIWHSPITRAIQDLAYEGFTHNAIGRATGCSTSCVAYRLSKLGVSTKNVRNGMNDQAVARIHRVLNKRGLKGLGAFHKKAS